MRAGGTSVPWGPAEKRSITHMLTQPHTHTHQELTSVSGCDCVDHSQETWRRGEGEDEEVECERMKVLGVMLSLQQLQMADS